MKTVTIKQTKNRTFQKTRKIEQSKSTLVTDITQLVLQLKSYDQQHRRSSKKQRNIKEHQKYSLRKAKLYCQIIQQCYGNKSNQLLLCSILGIPFIPGPVALNSIANLCSSKQDKKQSQQKTDLQQRRKINKQIVPLFRYLRKICEKQSYYCWIIYKDTQFNILNVKLFTKWQFVELQKLSATQYSAMLKKDMKETNLYFNQNKYKIGDKLQSQLSDESQSGKIQWDNVILGMFVENFSQQMLEKQRIHSVMQCSNKLGKDSIKQEWQYNGLSTKTTKQSFNKSCNIQTHKDKSMSVKTNAVPSNLFDKYIPLISQNTCSFKKQKNKEIKSNKSSAVLSYIQTGQAKKNDKTRKLANLSSTNQIKTAKNKLNCLLAQKTHIKNTENSSSNKNIKKDGFFRKQNSVYQYQYE